MIRLIDSLRDVSDYQDAEEEPILQPVFLETQERAQVLYGRIINQVLQGLIDMGGRPPHDPFQYVLSSDWQTATMIGQVNKRRHWIYCGDLVLSGLRQYRGFLERQAEKTLPPDVVARWRKLILALEYVRLTPIRVSQRLRLGTLLGTLEKSTIVRVLLLIGGLAGALSLLFG